MIYFKNVSPSLNDNNLLSEIIFSNDFKCNVGNKLHNFLIDNE